MLTAAYVNELLRFAGITITIESIGLSQEGIVYN